jgi:hypothetical protein
MRLRLWDAQIFADFTGSEFDDFPMAWISGNFLGSTIDVNSVIATLSKKFATVTLKMPD